MHLPRLRTLWFSAALLLAVVAGAWLLVPRSRITQANYDRIQEGMSDADVNAILGYTSEKIIPHVRAGDEVIIVEIIIVNVWRDGPNKIVVGFANRKVRGKEPHFATLRETLTWYAKKGAAKIGVKWD